MKLFSNYLKESQEAKKYAFKIKIAGDLPEHCEDVLEAALQKFQVSKFTKGKSTPIQASLLDFPEIKNAAMSVFEVELDYPTTSTVVTELIASCTGINAGAVRVRTPLEEANWEIENENCVSEDNKKDPLLSQDYAKENNQNLAGDKYVSTFLKDLAKTRKGTGPTQYKGVNDAILAKKMPSEKAVEMPKAGPARSLFASTQGKTK
jgi:hypothetical protein